MRWLGPFIFGAGMAAALAIVFTLKRGIGFTALLVLPLLAVTGVCGWLGGVPWFVMALYPWFLIVLLAIKIDNWVLYLTAIVLLPVALFGGMWWWERRSEDLAEHGIPATAEVLAVRDLNTNVGPDPMIELRLRVTPSVGIPYETKTTLVVSRLKMDFYQPGASAKVKYDPNDPSRVVVESVSIARLP